MNCQEIEKYSFHYSGVMDNAMKSLPLGNGDIGANVWLSQDGKLHLLISKTDSWSELYRLLKPAHAVLDIAPSPFKNGATFDLSIADGILKLSAEKTGIQIYVDAFAPCIRVSLKTEIPSRVGLHLENYRSMPFDPKDDFSNYFVRGGEHGIVESADIVQATPCGGVAQVHRNSDSCYTFSLRNQDMESYIGKEKDPLLGFTFGVGIYSPDMRAIDNGLIQDNVSSVTASIFVESMFAQSADEFIGALDDLYRHHGDESREGLVRHTQSWREFWEKAYIYAEGDDLADIITKAFLYQRYMTRCADRGKAPIKYNGSLFVADQMNEYPENYDARRWGAPYWFQNTRLIYWYLLRVGDYDSMLPMFDMYLNMMPIATARCEQYFAHPGMLIPETVSFFGLYANLDYGYVDANGVRRAQKNKNALRRGESGNQWTRYHYNGMLELSWMMLEYLKLSNDDSRRSQMLEFIEQVLLFFNYHFDRFDGKLVLNPISALETWQLCVNDAPDVVGLKVVCEKLRTMDSLPKSLCQLVDQMLESIPNIPTEVSNGETVLAPCEIKIDTKPRNYENPELYSVFPYGLYGVGKPDLDLARRTYDQRLYRLEAGWSQDPIDAALLGLTDEAAKHLARQSAMTDVRALFPAFWGPNFDETPDQDHGCVTALCLIHMLLQTDGETYTAFPAWPEKWNVRFKLPINHNSYVYGEQINGVRKVLKQTK